eukprot:COSAG01_NODE_90_length_27307_cov_734.166458_15_plen_116_part_00
MSPVLLLPGSGRAAAVALMDVSTTSLDAGSEGGPPILQEVLPKAGLVYSEKGNLSEVLCKPKIMAIKSPSLVKLEEMEKLATSIEEQARAEQVHVAAAGKAQTAPPSHKPEVMTL